MTPEQAQTVAEIRERKYFETTRAAAVNKLLRDRQELLQIIDSQAAENGRLKEELRLVYVEIINLTTVEQKIEVFQRIVDGRAEFDRIKAGKE